MIAKTTTMGTGTFVVVLGRHLVIRKTTTKVPVPFVVVHDGSAGVSDTKRRAISRKR